MSFAEQISLEGHRPLPERWAAKALLVAIWVYRHSLSRLIGGQCRFYPSCSVYGRDALQRRRLGPALWLIVRRLARCHPLHPGGYDPLEPDESPPEHLADAQAPRTGDA